MHIMKKISSTSNLKKMIEIYTPTYRVLLMNGIKIDPFNIEPNISVGELVDEHPEWEYIYEQLNRIKQKLDSKTENIDYVRENIISPGKVNIAGFTDFLWNDRFVEEINNFCKENDIEVNQMFLPKYQKKGLQQYISLCNNIDELPDILIGKGFSTLMSQNFIDKFIKPGYFDHPIDIEVKKLWEEKGIKDEKDRYHVLGVQQEIIIQNLNIDTNIDVPKRWSDLMKPEYYNSVTQTGKPQRDHFGFILMFYLYDNYGENGIRKYANSVKNKSHFSVMVKDIVSNQQKATPFNVAHGFTSLFFRNNPNVRVLNLEEGNPVSAIFCLIKKNASKDAVKLVKHLFSDKMAQIFSSTADVITANPNFKDDKSLNIRWIGWDKIMNAKLPYLKDELSELAYEIYDKKENNIKNKIVSL